MDDEAAKQALDQFTAFAKLGANAERISQMLIRVLLQEGLLTEDRREVLAQLLNLSAGLWEQLGHTNHATETRQLLALVEPSPEQPRPDLPE